MARVARKELQDADAQQSVHAQHVPDVLRVAQVFEVAVQRGVGHAAEGRADHDRQEIHAHVHTGFLLRGDPGDIFLDAR